jgi:hypothetical protein
VSLLATGFESIFLETVWREKDAIAFAEANGKKAVSLYGHKSK